MHFRHRSRSQDAPVVLVNNDNILPSSPNSSITPKTLEEILILSSNIAKTTPTTGSSDGSCRSHGLSQSVPSLEQRKYTTPERIPTSRKTGFATIHTDPTETHAAFESDAFAVLMPTTRLPIVNQPMSPTIPSSLAARAEAYRTYQEKARQMREENNSQGVHMPSKLVSYGYNSTTNAGHHASLKVELSPPNNPSSPAGAFPISPPLAQGGWTRIERLPRTPVHGPRHEVRLNNVSTPRKPLAASKVTAPPRTYRADSEAGASFSTPSPIKAHVKPKLPTLHHEQVQIESRYSLYNRSIIPPSPTRSFRSPSPVTSMPNVGCHSSVDGDSIFGYKSKDVDGTVAGASSTSPKKDVKQEKIKMAEKGKKSPMKQTLTSRWPWLRPSGPRIGKLTTAPLIFAAPPIKLTNTCTSTASTLAYIDPFTSLPASAHPSTPTARRSLSPKKSVHGNSVPPRPSTPQFDTGFAQIQNLTWVLFKMCLVLYGLVAMWFILDAVREAIYALGAPFRVVKWICGWVVWG
jgi:hypothetical protein